jgi:hypothetical protein
MFCRNCSKSENNKQRPSSIWKSAGWGALIGLALGLITAPKSSISLFVITVVITVLLGAVAGARLAVMNKSP